MEIENRNPREDMQRDTKLDQQLKAAMPEPRPALHDNIMHSVRQTPQLRRPYRRIAAALAAVLCLCVIGVALIEGGFSPSYAPDMDMSTDQNQAADDAGDLWASDSDGYFGKTDMEAAEDRPLQEPEAEPPLDSSELADDPNYSAPDKAEEIIRPGIENSGSTQPPDAPTLALPKKITLRFTKNSSGVWTAPMDGTVYRLYFGEGNTLQLYDAAGHAAYGAADIKGEVQLTGIHTYSGTLTRADAQTYVLTLQRAD